MGFSNVPLQKNRPTVSWEGCIRMWRAKILSTRFEILSDSAVWWSWNTTTVAASFSGCTNRITLEHKKELQQCVFLLFTECPQPAVSQLTRVYTDSYATKLGKKEVFFFYSFVYTQCSLWIKPNSSHALNASSVIQQPKKRGMEQSHRRFKSTAWRCFEFLTAGLD